MKVLAVIQARMGSTRLPGKVMMSFGETTVIGYLCSQIQRCKYVDDIVVATSVQPENDPLEQYLKENNIEVFRGSEDNVLDRFMNVIEKKSPDIVVRITGDNPFTCPVCTDYLILSHMLREADYSYFRGLPLGTSAEIVNVSALREISELNLEDYHREHVTIYLKEHPEKYVLNFVVPPENLLGENIRLTVDTEEDYRLGSYIMKNIEVSWSQLVLNDIIHFIKNNPHILQWNSDIQQKER